jgi:large subunit ribosomal protein L13
MICVCVGCHRKIPSRQCIGASRVLRDGYLPIVTSRWRRGDIVLEQTAFGVLPDDKVVVTGKKETNKKFMTYSGWKGGEKFTSVAQIRARHPEKLITHAVRGMVPKNRLGRVLMTKLKVYKGDQHPHAAQKTEPLTAAK